MSNYSIRKDTCNGKPRLSLYRKFERTWSQGQAYETASGFWIVSRPNSAQDVARTEKEARAMLMAGRTE
jgi:cytochrome P450